MSEQTHPVKLFLEEMNRVVEYFIREYSVSYAAVIGILSNIGITGPLMTPLPLQVKTGNETIMRLYVEIRDMAIRYLEKGANPIEISGACLILSDHYSHHCRKEELPGDEWRNR